MFVLRHFFRGLASMTSILLTLYMLILAARCIISWISADPYNPVVRFIYSATEPILYRVRRTIPCIFGGVDLAPIFVFMAIAFLQEFLVGSLYELAAMF